MAPSYGRRLGLAGTALGLALSASCVLENNNYSVWFANSPRGSYDFVAYSVGDTVRLYGVEMYQSMSDKWYSPSSDQAPDLYTWTSSAPDKVELVDEGVFVMKEIGNATIGVRTTHGSFNIPISVLPLGSSLRLAPRDPQATVGARVVITPEILDSQKSPAPVTLRASNVEFRLVGNVPDVYPQTTPPILVQELNTYTFSVNRVGTVNVVAFMRLYKGATLKDSVLVTVK